MKLDGNQLGTLQRVLQLIDKGECDPAFDLLFDFLCEQAEGKENDY